MWRELRWIGILLTLAIPCQSASYAANLESKRISSSQHIRVVSVTPDTAGNFVLLNTQKLGQLPYPTIRYLPAPDGRVLMTVDFAGASLLPDQTVLTFDQSSIKQVRIGQLQSFPPILRISMLADKKDAFGKVEIRSNPGALTIKLPDAVGSARAYDRLQVAPRTAPQIARSLDQAPPVAPSKPAPRLTANDAATLRGPIVEDSPSDVTYTSLEEVRPAPPRGIKKMFKKLFGESPEQQLLETREEPTVNDGVSRPVPAKAKPPTKPPVKTLAQDVYGPPLPPVCAKTIPAAESAELENCLTITYQGADPLSLQLAGSRKFSYRSFRLREPDRLVIDLDGLPGATSTELPDLPLNPWARGLRIGSPDGSPNITRVVIDLTGEQVGATELLDDKCQLLQITLQQPGIAQLRQSVPKDTLVVLDAGHGGSDPGAQRGDVREKELTLAIVEKLRKQLEASGLKVRLTRADDSYVSLEERVKFTNSMQPDAFVSVHINSLETNVKTTGIETYYQNEQSKDLANLIHGSLVNGLGAPDRSVRKARFYVINHTPVPAILAEVGFISNKDERDKLNSSDYQKQVATALADGVMLFLSEKVQSHPVARQSPPAGSESASGTISTTSPSTATQSFTQNLHSPQPKNWVEKRPQARSSRALAARQTADKRKTNSYKHPVKFKKHRLATTRS